jgi:hypothetical protein
MVYGDKVRIEMELEAWEADIMREELQTSRVGKERS